MNKRLVMLIFLSFAIISAFADAKVFYIEQPASAYSIGDTLSVKIGTDGAESWVSVDLICGNKTKMLYYHHLTKTDVSAEITAPLTKEFLGGLSGSCYLSIISDAEEKKSITFDISGEIIPNINFGSENFMPGENAAFTGSAKKTNGKETNGFAEIKIPIAELNIIVPVVKDQFSGNLSLSDSIASGEYSVDLFVYEKNEKDETTNFGSSNSTITILQKPTMLIIDAPKKITPGQNFEFKIILSDQTGNTMDGKTMAFKLRDANGNEIYSGIGKTGEANNVEIKKDAVYGNWNLSAISEEIIEMQSVYIEQYSEAIFTIANGTLRIQNIGNVPYNKPVEVKIGDYKEIKEVNLSIGGSVDFKLSAPDGTYTVGVNDGISSMENSVALTGKSISIGSSKFDTLDFLKSNKLLWIFVISVFLLFLLISSRKMIKEKIADIKGSRRTNSIDINNAMPSKSNVMKVIPGERKSIIESTSPYATHAMVIDGERQTAGLIALKIKNSQEINASGSNAKETINKAINLITDNKGKVYRVGDFIIGIFAPTITRTFENSFNAIKISKEISQLLNNHNNRYVQKIKFGIGISEGDIIAKKENGKLNFTPLGSALSNAKTIAEMAENSVLLSEGMQRKAMSKVKTIPNAERFGVKTYALNEIVDRENNAKFISKFLDRNPEYKKMNDYRKW